MESLTETLQDKIDRLVDGELGEEERAGLLGELEGDPASWRRCALTFLESQMVGTTLAPADAPEPESLPSAGGRRAAQVFRIAGMAAAVALAFVAGFAANPGASPADAGPSAEIAPVPGGNAPAFQQVLFEHDVLDGRPMYATREEIPPFMLQALVLAGHKVRQIERTLQLASDGGGLIELPVFETHIVDMRPQTL